MKQTVACILLLSLLLLSACAGAPPKVEVSSDTLFVKAIPSLPKDFILGMDVSSVLAEEARTASRTSAYASGTTRTTRRAAATAAATTTPRPPQRSAAARRRRG